MAEKRSLVQKLLVKQENKFATAFHSVRLEADDRFAKDLKDYEIGLTRATAATNSLREEYDAKVASNLREAHVIAGVNETRFANLNEAHQSEIDAGHAEVARLTARITELTSGSEECARFWQ
eukprot:9463543-Heterocapsa_arctica.AAC.1